MPTATASSKVALVTGANKGIGREIARQLGKQGITVFVGARDPERGAAAAKELCADGIDARFIQLDITDEASIAAAAKTIENAVGRLDILVNNAGIAIDAGPPSKASLKRLRTTYETNVFGTVAATQGFLPLIRKSKAGRIVNMSSGLGSIGTATQPDADAASAAYLAYSSSKSALNSVTVHFARELRDAGIKVNAACPGFVATDLNQHRGTRTVQQGAATPVRLATLPDDGPTAGYFNDDGPIPW